MSADKQACHYCGSTDEELRPYGPGGEPLCFPCMMADPEREAAAGRAYMAQLDAAEAIGGGVATLTPEGPVPGVGDGR